MSCYIYGATLPYGDYLRNDATGGEGPELNPRVAAVLGSPTAPVDWPAGPTVGTAVFDWGRCEKLAESDAFNVPLSDLKNAAKTTAEMWAVEQFGVARDAWRRGLYREALDYLRRAMTGHAGHEGYALDFRSHFLLGLIRLGSHQHHDPGLLALDLAEEAFLAAGRYATCDYPAEAAWAYFAAGWSCYCQGKMQEALHHTQQALSISDNHADAQFQAAKILMHGGAPDLAGPFLARAVSLNPGYAIQACADADFATELSVVLHVIELERDTVGRRASQALKDLAPTVAEAGIGATVPANAEGAPDPLKIEPEGQVVTLMEAAKTAFSESTLCGYLRAEAAAAAAVNAVTLFVARLRNERIAAEEAVRAAQRQLAETIGVELGAYRVSETSASELSDARARIEKAAKAFETGSLPGYIDAEAQAKRAGTLLKQAVERCRELALRRAKKDYEALQREIAELHRHQRGAGGGSVKGFSLIGAIVALYVGTYLSYFSVGIRPDFHWGEMVLRFGLLMIVFAVIGAVIGALLAPFFAAGTPVPDDEPERRLAAARESISALHRFSVSRRDHFFNPGSG